MSYFQQCISKYATFSGRARRAEYWYYTLYLAIYAAFFGVLDEMLFVKSGAMLSAGPLSNLFLLATLLPTSAVTVRRFHDTGRSGWMWVGLSAAQIIVMLFGVVSVVGTVGLSAVSLSEPEAIVATFLSMGVSFLLALAIGVVMLVFLCQDSQAGANKYGPNPKETAFSTSNYGQHA